MTGSQCPCGGVLVEVPTCGKCGETWLAQPTCVLLDHAKRGTVPCARRLTQHTVCALDNGHTGECAPGRGTP